MALEILARQSQGSTSSEAIYQMVARASAGRYPGGGVLLDMGCGAGELGPFVCKFLLCKCWNVKPATRVEIMMKSCNLLNL